MPGSLDSLPTMSSHEPDPQDPLIRTILISAATLAVSGFLATVLLVTVMLSDNFNFMNWME
jgi:hypothetical protein